MNTLLRILTKRYCSIWAIKCNNNCSTSPLSRISETLRKTLVQGSLFLLIEAIHIILELVDPGTNREWDADGADDCITLIKGLNLDLHLREVLFCTPDDDVPVSPVTEAHDDKRVDLGEHFLVDVFGLLGYYTEPDPELPPFHRTFPEDLGT